jgi:hypothetical protein
MADFRVELERLSRKINDLQRKNEQLSRKVRSNGATVAYPSMLVKAEEDIKPDETGQCVAMYRLTEGSSPYLKLKERPILKFKVYNHRKTPIWEGEEFHVVRDNWNHYYRINGFIEASFFLVPDGGIPAASGKFSPGGTDCQRYYFDKPSSHIDPVEDPSTGGPVFEFVWNHTENQIAAGKVVQAKKIDGEWFVDVEPC